jgi:hypothetical protein
LVDSGAEIRALKRLVAGDQQKMSKALWKRLKDRIRNEPSNSDHSAVANESWTPNSMSGVL